MVETEPVVVRWDDENFHRWRAWVPGGNAIVPIEATWIAETLQEQIGVR